MPTLLRSDMEVAGRPTGFRERALGCLLGGAVGDALGTPVKNQSLRAIRQKFGELGVQGLSPAYGRMGAISSITQMTLFTAEGIIRAFVRQRMRGLCHPPSVVACAYLRWLVTQGERVQTPDYITSGWLLERQGVHERRGPSGTCVEALSRENLFGDVPVPNQSKGAAALTRTAPVAFANDGHDLDGAASVYHLAAEIAQITHGHPTAACSAGVFTVVIHSLLWGYSIQVGIARARVIAAGKDGHEEVETILGLLEALVEKRVLAAEALKKLGRGQLAHEALAMSLYCALTAQDYEDGVLAAINHDGDSDAVGSLTGQLLGAARGLPSVPDRWVGQLELRTETEIIANDLAEFLTWPISEYGPWSRLSDDINRHYPGY